MMEKELIISCEHPNEFIEFAKKKLSDLDFQVTENEIKGNRNHAFRISAVKKSSKRGKYGMGIKAGAPITLLSGAYMLLTGNITALPIVLGGGAVTTASLLMKESADLGITITGIGDTKENETRLKIKIKNNTENADYYFQDQLEDDLMEFYNYCYQGFVKHKDLDMKINKKQIQQEYDKNETMIKSLQEDFSRGVIEEEKLNEKMTGLNERKESLKLFLELLP